MFVTEGTVEGNILLFGTDLSPPIWSRTSRIGSQLPEVL